MKKRMFAVSTLLMAAAIAGTSVASSATVMCAYAETADEDKVELLDRDIDDVTGTLESITAEYTGNGLSSDNPKPSKDDLIVKGQYTVTPSSGKSYSRTETITDYTIIRYSRPGVTAGGVMKTRDGRTGMITIWIITARDKNTGKDVSCNIQIPYVIQNTELVSDDKDNKKTDSDDKTEEIVDTEDTDQKPEDGSGKTVSGLDGNDSKSTSSDDDEEIIDTGGDSLDSSKEDTSKDKKEEFVTKKDKKKSRKAAKKPSKKKRSKGSSKRKKKAARKRLSTKKKKSIKKR